MARPAFRSTLAAASLASAVLIFSWADKVEAKSTSGIGFKPKWGRTSQQIDKLNTSSTKQTTAKRRALCGKPEAAKN